jgi:hypothetical protein
VIATNQLTTFRIAAPLTPIARGTTTARPKLSFCLCNLHKVPLAQI